MKRIHQLSVALLQVIASVATPLWSQQNPRQQLVAAMKTMQTGAYDQAIYELQPLTDSSGLSKEEQGRAWTLLGYSYKEGGSFRQAQAAYEKALAIFRGDTQNRLDYANVLNNLADLYRDTGQLAMAKDIWTRALPIYAELGNGLCISEIYTNLAGIAVELNKKGEAKKLMAKAEAESKVSSEMTDDARAGMAITEGWIAAADGHHAQALSEYQDALGRWRVSHGERHPLTAWGYVLVGKAYAENGQLPEARENVQRGLAILKNVAGPQNPKYLAGEMVYSAILRSSGMTSEASTLRSSAQRSLDELRTQQCANCTISVSTLLPR